MAVITISRGTFGGGTDLAERVSEKLGCRCISREELIKSASRYYGVKEEEINKAEDNPLAFWNRWIMAGYNYRTCIRAALFRELAQGDIVYHGYVGHLLLYGVPNLLKVRVTASMECRIKSVTEQKGFTSEKAIDYIKCEDKKRAKWTKFIYGVDWDDPSLYDLVINIETLDVQNASELVVNFARSDKFRDTPETKKILNDLILTSEVKAVLSLNKGLIGCGVSVRADDGIITLGGFIYPDDKAEKIINVVKTVQGVTDIKSKMRIPRVFG